MEVYKNIDENVHIFPVYKQGCFPLEGAEWLHSPLTKTVDIFSAFPQTNTCDPVTCD
jgi:hypothetical protein